MGKSIRSGCLWETARDLAAAAIATILFALPLAFLVEAIGRLTAGLTGDSPWHIGWISTGALIVLCWIPGRHVGPAAIARYDAEAMQPSAPGSSGVQRASPLSPAQQHAWDAIVQWCQHGAGNGSSPFLFPWVLPKAEQRFAVAVLTGPKGAGKSRLAVALSRHLDGNDSLSQLTSGLARWRLKLRVKIADCAWWRMRKSDHPWDCGYLIENAAAIDHLHRFLPRRPTLLIADELTAGSLAKCVGALHARQHEFRHPVRVLIVDTVVPGWRRPMSSSDPDKPVDARGDGALCFDAIEAASAAQGIDVESR